MAQKLWFTADAHLGHENIIKLENRPFANIEEHDEGIVNNWNETVGERDTVWFLGDLAYRCDHARIRKIVKQLKGRIYIVWGNHDRRFTKKLYDKDNSLFVEAHEQVEIKYCGQRITLNHYAMRVWSGSHKGTWHLHGHSHGNLSEHGASMDVGMPCHHFRPISFEQVEAHLKGRPPVFHHATGADFYKAYPQHRLLQSHQTKLNNIKDFLRWNNRQGGVYSFDTRDREDVDSEWLLRRWLGVDEEAYEEEKKCIVDYVRGGQDNGER